MSKIRRMRIAAATGALSLVCLLGCVPLAGRSGRIPAREVHPGAKPPDGRAPGQDPVEVARRASLYRISMVEISRPLGPERLLPYCADPDPSIRAAAIQALGRSAEALAAAAGDPKPFVEALLPFAADPSAEVRAALASAIGLIGPAASGRLGEPFAAEENPDIRRAWVRAAGRVAPIPEAGDPSEREAAEDVPEETSEEASFPPEVRLLEEALQDDQMAAAASLALGVYGLRYERGGAGIPPLPDTLVSRIRARFDATSGSDRLPFAYAMWRLRQPETTPELRRGLADVDPRVRGVCARGLGGISGAHGRRHVARLLRDPNVWTRVEAARALATMEDPGGASAIELVRLLEQSDPPAVPGRRRAAGSTHAAVAAADALGDLGFRETAEALRMRLVEESPYLFSAVAGAYVKVSDAASVEDLRELVEDRSSEGGWRHRKAVAEALGGLKSVQEAEADASLAANAISARVPGEAHPLFEALLADPDVRVRAAALDAYAKLAGAAARARLVEMLASNDEALVGVAAERLRGLGKEAGEEAGPALVEAFVRFRGPDPETAAGLAVAVGELGGVDGALALEEAARSPSNALMLAAARALRTMERTPPVREEPPAGAPSEKDWLAVADLTRMTVRTSRGEVTVRLRPDVAPVTVLHFAALAADDFFDGVAFHRVVPAFVAQGGDPRGDGWGGPGSSIPCELSDLPYETGTLGMALSGRDTGGSQFFFTLTPQPHLEHGYTVFGRVIRGMDVVDRIEVGDTILDVTFP